MNKREWMLRAALSVQQFDTHAAADHADRLGAIYDAICAASPEPVDDGWIEHRGEKPYPEAGVVEVRFRNGQVTEGYVDMFVWAHDGEFPDEEIIAWRPAT